MTPSSSDASFWAHIPGFLWPLIIAGVVGLSLYEAVRASESVARVFGGMGRSIYERAQWKRRIEDKLDAATTYLCLDAEWHRESDVIIAEHCPGVFKILPKRIAYTEFAARWATGWRP